MLLCLRLAYVAIAIMLRAPSSVMLRVFYVITYGMNSYKNQEKDGKTIHAECDAIRKLPSRKNKSIKKINMLVIRTTKTGKLSMSKPCYNCIMNMMRDAPKKGYKIEWIYYSDEEGNVVKEKLVNLNKGDFHFSSYYKFKLRQQQML